MKNMISKEINSTFQIDEQELKIQKDNLINFLNLIYPFLENNNYNRNCIELRPIYRGEDKRHVQSMNLWRLDAKGKIQLDKFLHRINGMPVCVYYSVFTMNYELKATKEDGSPYIRGMINTQNALNTYILAMDFDDLSTDEHTRYRSIIVDNLGIETISIASGHGYQEIILLDEPINDKDILRKFTHLLLSKGFPIDGKIIDSARIMRLPYTFNCKAFDPKSKYYNSHPEGINVKILSITKKRYTAEDIFLRISDLPTIYHEYENEHALKTVLSNFNGISNIISQDDSIIGVKANYDACEGDDNFFASPQDMYPMLNLDLVPDAVQRMLVETPEKYRDSALVFLVSFLRNRIGLPLDGIIEVMKVWNINCKPPEGEHFTIDKVKRIYGYNYEGTGAYTADLAQKFGYIEFKEYRLKNKVIIPNSFFRCYKDLHKAAIRIFLMMKVAEAMHNVYEWDFQTIAKYSKVSEKTVKRYLNQLVDLRFLDIKKGNKKAGDTNKYFISKFADYSKGFIQFNRATLRMMVYDEDITLDDHEIMVYTYIYSMIHGHSRGECNASQRYISKHVGIDHTRVCRTTDELVRKGWISKRTYAGRDNKSHCLYYLMF